VPLAALDENPAPEPEPVPGMTRLAAAFPNPFAQSTRIQFELGQAGPVVLAVYDVSGRVVARLIDDHRAPGYYEATWDGRTSHGERAPSGQYFYRLRAPGSQETRKVLLVR
jgi:hypothetical protein